MCILEQNFDVRGPLIEARQLGDIISILHIQISSRDVRQVADRVFIR